MKATIGAPGRTSPAFYESLRAGAIATALLIVSSCATEDPPLLDSLRETCVLQACHNGVEQIHYGGRRLACVDCHLGDDTNATKEGAHVTVDISFNPSTPGSTYLEQPSIVELDELPPDVIQFINPADYRVAQKTCGSSILGGGNCHTTITENSLILNRATLAGTFAGGGFMAGTQDKRSIFGVQAITDPWVPEILPVGVVADLGQLPATTPSDIPDPVGKAFFPVFEQLCIECHLRQDGRRFPGRYYSSGCNACHMITTNDARSETGDLTQDPNEFGHVKTHRFTNLVPDAQCAHCHISHLGRSMLAQGVRERSEPEGDHAIDRPNRGVEDPEAHVPWGKENYVRSEGLHRIYGKPYPFFIEDEDGENDVDETPPDIHTEKGLGCIDCHNIREMHGDKHMAERMDRELDVRCQSCHGRPGELASLNSDAGLAFARSGTAAGATGENLTVFDRDAQGEIRQRGRFTERHHPVTQITRRTDPTEERHNPRTRMGCELHAGTAEARAAVKREVNQLSAESPELVAEVFPGLPEGFVFTEVPDQDFDGRLECFACHNRWTLNCYGCHIVRDDRVEYTSALTGQKHKGKASTFGMSVLADALSLGFNARGHVTPMVGTSIFFTHIDENGTRILDSVPLTTGEGLTGEGNLHNPVHHHTIRKIPRDCDGCHPSETGSHDEKALLRAAGLGTGEFTFTDGEGRVHWLDRLVLADYDGDGQSDDPAALGVPDQPLQSVQRIVGTTHDTMADAGKPQPGPLDLETINRLFMNRVVPQRPAEASEGAPPPEGSP